ncbi:hypothetical protein [Crenothrix sp.]|uniref:hypothetical protein n=1 Tax=Crenothrix sp. TaxID=3100433 RepID=UPI00374D12DA
MKNIMKLGSLGLGVGIALVSVAIGLGFSSAANADKGSILYVGDGGDDTVKRFDAKTGRYLGAIVTSKSNGLLGPMGLLSTDHELIVANQNVNQPYNGEVLKFNRNSGIFTGALVPCQDALGRPCDPNSPFTPRGIIKGSGEKLFVADLFGSSFDPTTEGSVKEYNFKTGQFIRNLDTTGFTDKFYPRGVVIGPDGLLYVSVRGFGGLASPLPGYVLRFNPLTGKFKDVFTSYQPTANDCSKHLHRPEGLVFGPDNKLYITSFQAYPQDNDKILIYDRTTKKCIDQIDLYAVGQTRAFSQAIVFGPNGDLFVSIQNTPTPPFTGEVRRCNVKTKKCQVFVRNTAKGGALLNPWYLTFGETDPRTLKYDD